ncbi:helix-turn-helix transcriptional regulator [Spirillospora sp. NPDC052269]
MNGGRAPQSRWELAARREEARLAQELGSAVRERRLALGLSQVELAGRAGMTQPALSRLETGGPIPAIGVLSRLAHVLGTRLTVTFTDEA